MSLSPHRLLRLNALPERREGAYVLYWMVAARRTRYNPALEHAIAEAHRLHRPLVVVEPLRCGYRWASDRIHAAILQGMRDNQADFAEAGVRYHPWVEPSPDAGAGMLASFAKRACIVVTDASPIHFLPRWQRAAARAVDVRLDAVDGHGLFPLAATPGPFATAHAFRRFLQKHLSGELERWPVELPLGDAPATDHVDLGELGEVWPAASPALLDASPEALAALPIDHTVPPVRTSSGPVAARLRLAQFVGDGLSRYGQSPTRLDDRASSGLGGALHFGHLAACEVVDAVLGAAGGSRLGHRGQANGKKTGWWGISDAAELFLDQVVTWRELGAVEAWHRPDTYDCYESVPQWARAVLAAHAEDVRPVIYDLRTLAMAATHDALWNAAQRQLVREGHIQSYLRMLWAKKVLEWSPTPAEAFGRLTELNNRYALDGRDPNSASGISWCFGRYDRPWGPVRPIFGTVRYMSCDCTRRKMDTRAYLQRNSE